MLFQEIAIFQVDTDIMSQIFDQTLLSLLRRQTHESAYLEFVTC